MCICFETPCHVISWYVISVFSTKFPWNSWLDVFDRYNPFRGRKPVGSVSQNRPPSPFCTAPPPQRQVMKRGHFQDGRNTEVFMKTTEPDKNQLTIKIDRRHNLLLERWPTFWPKAMDQPPIHLFSEVAKPWDMWMPLWQENQEIIQTYNHHSEVQSVWTTDQSNSNLM